MSQVKSFRSLALAPAMIVAISALAACQQADAPASQETEAAQTSPDAKPGISGSNGRLVLSVVEGRPAAVYFTVRNDGPSPATLAGVHVAGIGEAQMHKTKGGSMSAVDKLEIAPGKSLEFAPGGLHVMGFDPDKTLKAGDSTELTLTFADGDKLSMPLRVKTMGGEANHDEHMPGMKH